MLKLLVAARKSVTCLHRESLLLNKIKRGGECSNEVLTFRWKLSGFNKPVNFKMHRRFYLNVREFFFCSVGDWAQNSLSRGVMESLSLNIIFCLDMIVGNWILVVGMLEQMTSGSSFQLPFYDSVCVTALLWNYFWHCTVFQLADLCIYSRLYWFGLLFTICHFKYLLLLLCCRNPCLKQLKSWNVNVKFQFMGENFCLLWFYLYCSPLNFMSTDPASLCSISVSPN